MDLVYAEDIPEERGVALKLKILHTIGSLGVAAGGPSRTVPALCQAIQRVLPDAILEILTSDGSPFGGNVHCDGVSVNALPHPVSMRAFADALRAMGWSKTYPDARVILHDHGQWLPCNRASASVARSMKCRRVVTPRGMLSPWAMRYRWAKKQAAWWAFARRDLRQADVLHATSQLEADELRAIGARQPIAVIPNGVAEAPSFIPSGEKQKTVLFLSRIHPKKGVSELVQVWRKLKLPDWRLVLAGPDETGIIESLALHPGENICYVGEKVGQEKWELLQRSAVFILPSYSENFGVVVAEALMAGTPVIATHGTPWESLVTNRCGWWVPMEKESLGSTLQTATSMDLAMLASMGVAGKSFATSAFSWPSIGQQMADVYEWLAGDTVAAPACVQHFK